LTGELTPLRLTFDSNITTKFDEGDFHLLNYGPPTFSEVPLPLPEGPFTDPFVSHTGEVASFDESRSIWTHSAEAAEYLQAPTTRALRMLLLFGLREFQSQPELDVRSMVARLGDDANFFYRASTEVQLPDGGIVGFTFLDYSG
jgi:hypothetical protein